MSSEADTEIGDTNSEAYAKRLSRITPIKVPEFESKIPPHLLTAASPEMRYIMETLSVVDQKATWGNQVVADINRQLIYTNGDVMALKKFKESINPILPELRALTKTSKGLKFSWKLIIGTVGCLAAFVTFTLEVIRAIHP